MKRCNQCCRTFPLEHFGGKYNCPDCRENKREYDRQRYESNKQYRVDRNKDWREQNQARFLPNHRIRASRRRARKLEATCEVFTQDDLIVYWITRGIDPNRCFYCDGPYQDNDHLVPLARGGAHERANIVPACQPCNDSKGAKLLSEWRGGIYQDLAGRLPRREEAAAASALLCLEIAEPNPTLATQQATPETA